MLLYVLITAAYQRLPFLEVRTASLQSDACSAFVALLAVALYTEYSMTISPIGDRCRVQLEVSNLNVRADPIQRAKSSGLSREFHSELALVEKYHHLLHQILPVGGPATLPPIGIRLTSNARAVRAKLRNYTYNQAQFLKTFIDELVHKGHARKL